MEQTARQYNANSRDEAQSKAINKLRFVLIVLVLLMHSTGFPPLSRVRVDFATVDGWDVYNLFRLALGYVLGQGAVPAFFLISGYLFFRNADRFTRSVYTSKLKRRLRTLLIPYLLWNLLYVVILFLPLLYDSVKTGTVTAGLSGFFSQNDFLSVFWAGKRGYPANVPMWFVRDLMVMCLASPAVYLLARKFKTGWPLFVVGCWLVRGWINLPLVQTAAFCFFSIGAYLGIERRNLLDTFAKAGTPGLILTAAVFLADTYQVAANRQWPVINSLFVLLWVTTVFQLAGRWLTTEKSHVPETLSGAVFFIFCAHDLTVVSCYDTLMWKLLRGASPWLLLCLFLTAPAVKIIICWTYRLILSRCLPKVLKLLTGGR